MSGSGGRPPGRTLPPPFSPPGARPAGQPGQPATGQPPAEPNPGSTSPGHAPAAPAPAPAPRAPRPSQPPPMGAPSHAAPNAGAPPISTQPLPSPPPPAAPRGPAQTISGPAVARPPAAGSTQIGPGFSGGSHAPPGQPAYRPPAAAPAAPIAPAPTAPTAPAPMPPTAASYPPTAASYPPPPAAPSYPPPAAPSAPGGYPPPAAGGAGFTPGGSFPPPPGGDPAFMQGFPPPGPGTDSVVAMPRGKFAGLIEMSVRRAFRLRIEPDEVLAAERAALELAQPPITDRNLQAFLAWRRSVLLVVATILAPLSILRLIDALRGPAMPSMFRAVGVLPALAEAAFCGICIWQLSNWTHWRQQRKMIFLGWAAFMATPFIVFLYPLSRAFGDVGGGEEQMLIGAFMSIGALLSLAPKAVSLMPGLTRAALVSKMLFPGSAGPGWLIVLAAPIYAVFAFLILIVPYQITGSGWFVLSMFALIGAQVILARAGIALAQPTNQLAAVTQVNRVRNTYLIANAVGVLFLIIALVQLVKTFPIGYLAIFTTLLSFAANVLILTMIGSDLVITNLDRARTLQQGTAKEVEETNLKLAAFVGGSEPPAPPPFR